jgi:hypothetical protein
MSEVASHADAMQSLAHQAVHTLKLASILGQSFSVNVALFEGIGHLDVGRGKLHVRARLVKESPRMSSIKEYVGNGRSGRRSQIDASCTSGRR